MKIIYVHGINEAAPNAESLKHDWDTHLFGKDNPDSSVVFWGDLSVYHQIQPKDLTMFDSLLCEILKIGTGMHLLQDVHNYFYLEGIREQVLERFHNALPTETQEPIIVVSHSQGTVIAYDALSQEQNKYLNIKKLFTIGSPLGLITVRSEMKRLLSVDVLSAYNLSWQNFSDLFDPVAMQHNLRDFYSLNENMYDSVIHNPTSPEAPHSIDGYFTCPEIKDSILSAIGLLS